MFLKIAVYSVQIVNPCSCSGIQEPKTLRTKLDKNLNKTLYSSVSKTSHRSFSFKQITEMRQKVNITIK